MSKHQTYIIIPARLSSTRFPQKILADIHGKTLMQRTYEQALKSNLGPVIMAVDDLEVQKLAHSFGAETCMTALSHISGTARISEVCEKLKLDPESIILNWQVDEPLLNIKNAEQVVCLLKNKPECQVATLCEKIKTIEELKNPNIVKVVLDHLGRALYFSRAPIPWDRSWPGLCPLPSGGGGGRANHFRHLGLYAYKTSFLLNYTSMPDCALEYLEGLEQLRFLYAGYKIAMTEAVENSMPGIDTPEDLARILSIASWNHDD